MSTTGVVLSVDVERYGDTLMAATTTTDTVLQVSDVVDFADEDDFAAGPQWLVIGDSEPMQYVAVDDDNDTVTLAVAVGAVYEAGEPVRMWDAAADAEVVSHVAWVELDEADDNDQPVPAEVSHDRVIFFGLANLSALIGAHVAIEQDDEDGEAWHVSEVIGREPAVDAGYVKNPRLALRLSANMSVPNAMDTALGPWTVLDVDGVTPPNADGFIRVDKAGWYHLVVTVMFDPNGTGNRSVEVKRSELAVPLFGTSFRRVTTAGTAGWVTGFQLVGMFEFYAGEYLIPLVRQNSGAALTLRGGSSSETTSLELMWAAPA